MKKILKAIYLLIKSIVKAKGRNLDGMLYSTFRATYRVHSQAINQNAC